MSCRVSDPLPTNICCKDVTPVKPVMPASFSLQGLAQTEFDEDI